MCGIVGYVGKVNPKEILYKGLEKLEYRGYDSAGISILSQGGEIKTYKAVGKLINLGKEIEKLTIPGETGIGHTRWATHGVPSVRNSHPHGDSEEKISIVHNGIIENYKELKKELIEKGYKFKSETDSEVIVHLLKDEDRGDLLEALGRVRKRLEGTYAIGVISVNYPKTIFVAREGSPLVIGVGEEENYIASDVPAILKHTKRVIFLEDGSIGRITPNSIELFTEDGLSLEAKETEIEWGLEAAEKNGYEHFTLKEIYEQPRVVKETLQRSIDIKNINLKKIEKIHIIGCGTSYHSALVGKGIIEKLLRIPVEVEVASEFRYKDPIVSERDLVIVISQSGETADTLAALREGKRKKAKTLGIINVVGSTISRESDGVIYTNAGLEIGVASTKAFIAQLIALYMFTSHLGKTLGILGKEREEMIEENLKKIPELIEEILKKEKEIKKVAHIFDGVGSSIFIGRNLNTAIAYEGALKLKEISYIHSEGYQGGELKHGPLALISDGCPLVAIATKGETYEKMKSNIEEVRARRGRVVALATNGDSNIKEISDEVIYLPEVDELFIPILNVIPLQILAYHVANNRGIDVDKPRNLAKSVTVE